MASLTLDSSVARLSSHTNRGSPRRSVAIVLHFEKLHKVTAAAFPTWPAVTSPSGLYCCSYLFSASGFLVWKHRLKEKNNNFLGEALWDLTASCQIAWPQLASGILQLSCVVTAVVFFGPWTWGNDGFSVWGQEMTTLPCRAQRALLECIAEAGGWEGGWRERRGEVRAKVRPGRRSYSGYTRTD